jgi:hypothetical protein
MTRTHALSSVLLAAGVFATVAAAAEPRTTLLEKKFQRAVATSTKYDVHGQAMYCKKDGITTFSRLPGYECLTEAQLREKVATDERWRNQVAYNHNITKGG